MRKLILLWLLLPIQGWADSSVWKVSDGHSELFIGGTIHVLSRQDYPLPEEFEQAYRQADLVILETDLAAMAQPEAQQRLLQQVMYPEGRSLQDDLRPETYRKLVDYVSSINLSMAALERFKPPMLVITLTMAELQRLGMGDTGVDHYFHAKALQDGKRLGELESVELQMKIIADMGKGQEDEMILSTLQELSELPVMMNDMKRAWRNGDMDKLEEIGIVPMREEFPSLYDSLLVERNNSWMPKIEALLATPETELVLVGALHLVANEGVIEQLKSRGYRVERW
ncbi:TraB/GumN family protein [Methylomarinum sp. Ch1-1]|uniref:TraB/GumN family protein n=1 Tax=Methylomarinum roseum TaxID=3067653 RepID=A0AAU7NTB8_9GAMM